jgi:formate-nitrite transporter family protein
MFFAPPRAMANATAKNEQATQLDVHEEKKSHEEESLNADITHVVVQREGDKQLERTSMALVWSSLGAGMSMGFSLIAEGLIHSNLPDAVWRPLLAKLGYTVGFVIVTLASQELFTEHTVTSVVPALTKRDRETTVNVGRIWGITLAFNIVGALIMAALIAYTSAFDPHVKETFVQIGREAVNHPTGTIFIRGIFAGWLIALMVWMLPAASSSSVLVTIVITYIVGLAGLSHIIAGSVEIMHLALINDIGWGRYFGWAGPAVLGNALGGVVFVALVNHLQVAAGKKKESHRIVIPQERA